MDGTIAGGESVVSVVESERRASVQRRSIPLEAHFTPRFSAELCAAMRASGGNTRGMAGLLFGRAERNVVTLQSFMGVTPDCAADARSCDREPLERVLDQMLAKCKLRTELAGLELNGWCCVLSSDNLSDAPPDWLQFHIRRFRRASDVFLIMRSNAARELSGHLYARASDLPISLEHYAAGQIAINFERPASRDVRVSISAKAESLDPEFYVRTYEAARALEKAEKKEARRETLRRILGWRLPRPALATVTDGLAIQPAPTEITNELVILPAAAPAVPLKQTAPQLAIVRAAVEEFTPKTAHRANRPLLITAGVLLAALAVTIPWFRQPPRDSAPEVPASLEPQNGGLGLGISVEGDALVVSWDRDAPAMRSATKGVLRIQDGSDRRNIELTTAELASGSIVYRPRSDDVDFLLTVYGAGGVTREGERAVDGTSARADAESAAPQLAPAAIRGRSTGIRSAPVRFAAPANPNPETSGSVQGYVAPKPLKAVMPDVADLDPSRLPAAGKIVIEVQIDDQGRVMEARIPAGAPKVSREAAQAAIAAAKQWRFEPAKLGGKSVPSRHRLVFDIQPGVR
jgi:TonB family protein